MKLLITGCMKAFRKELADLLGSDWEAQTASDGVQTLQLARSFRPDVLLLDLQLPRLDGLTVLQQLRVESLPVKVLAVLTVRSEYVRQALIRLEPDYVMVPPCTPTAVAARIQSFCPAALPLGSRAERTLADMLMLLGISPGSEGGRLLFHAVLHKLQYPEHLLTKDIYPALVKDREGLDWKYAERNIRTAIAAAFRLRTGQLWSYYFPADTGDKKPSNQVFISRLAQLLSLQDLR